MTTVTDFPILIFVLSLLVLWVAARVGILLRARIRGFDEEERNGFDLVVGGVLTLLGLLIGFSFSMAISRYDQRKNYEEEEANAISTEYIRADLLPATSRDAAHRLLVQYLVQRMQFYTTRSEAQLAKINDETTRLQNELWSEVRTTANAQPNAVNAVVVTGMNDVLNRGATPRQPGGIESPSLRGS